MTRNLWGKHKCYHCGKPIRGGEHLKAGKIECPSKNAGFLKRIWFCCEECFNEYQRLFRRARPKIVLKFTYFTHKNFEEDHSREWQKINPSDPRK